MGKQPVTLAFDTGKLEDMIRRLDGTGVDVRKTVEKELKFVSERYTMDTHLAISDQYLPAHGKYRSKENKTASSIIENPAVQWEGDVASIPVGFDFTKPGAGGFLLYGTPKMQPDAQLQKVYSKGYAGQLLRQIEEHLNAMIAEAFVG